MRLYSKRRLSVLFSPDEMAQIGAFLDREGGFSIGGEIALVQMLADVQEYDAPFDKILDGLEAEWHQIWSRQDLNVRGSPGAVGEPGFFNRVSLESFYLAFHTPSPLHAVPVEIPTKSFTVKTKGDSYQFGEADINGWRTVARVSGGLTFNWGKVRYVAIAKSMAIEAVVNSQTVMWHSTPVLYIHESDPQ